jgi:Putative zinc-binding metallo-peptidase
MSASQPVFRETHFSKTPIRDLGLTIAGTHIEPILASFERALEEVGIGKLRPHFYLSTEWGVPWGTTSIAIPFYLARRDLTELQAERSGFVEGVSPDDILRYLRHEMGHVVNYAYLLYEQEEWIKLFGSITQPYVEEYRPEPFSRRYVRHLPGWYAQKHPDEDWAETFAVWMTPGIDWRTDYAGWPAALAKLNYCDRTVHELGPRAPALTTTELDEDVAQLSCSLED